MLFRSMERLKEFFWGVTDREADPLRCGRSTSERAALSVVWGLVSFRPLLLGIVAMARQNWFQKLYWKYLSKPITERALLLHVIENPPSSILEIGMGSGERIQRLLNLIATASDGKPIRYTGVDPFESRSGQQALLTLKGAHRIFTERGIKAHLVPGEPTGALARVAHSVLPSDLILIDGYIGQGDADADAIAQWLPRLCHVQSTIFAAQNAGGVFLPIPRPTNAMPSQLPKAA